MGLFPIEIASGLTDRLASILATVGSTIEAARTALPPGDMFRRVSGSFNYEAERDFITPTTEFERNMSGITIFGGLTTTQTLINAFDSHTTKTASVGFNAYLGASGLQVPESFAQLYGQIRSTQLQARNVFASRDIVMATTLKVGAGNWTFSAGQNLGNGGTTTYDANTPNTGEQYLIASLPSGISTSNCTFSVSGLDDTNRIKQAAATFPNGVANAHVQVGIVRMRTITNISVTTDTGIANASVVRIVNKRERLITL